MILVINIYLGSPQLFTIRILLHIRYCTYTIDNSVHHLQYTIDVT